MVRTAALLKEVERLEAERDRRGRRLEIPADRAEFMRMAGFKPESWQAEVLRSDSKRLLLCCARQSGKTTVVGAKALHRALSVPRSFCLIFAPSLDQSLEFFRRVTELCYGLGMDNLDPESLRKTGLDLRNGSRVEARPGSERTARSRTADFLAIDEAARIDDELYHSLRPSLARTGGSLALLSTPWGKRGAYYDAWENGGPQWTRWEVTADDLAEDWYKPTTAQFLAEEREALPLRIYQQEYYCKFLEPEDAVFFEEDIRAAVSSEVRPLFVQKRGA